MHSSSLESRVTKLEERFEKLIDLLQRSPQFSSLQSKSKDPNVLYVKAIGFKGVLAEQFITLLLPYVKDYTWTSKPEEAGSAIYLYFVYGGGSVERSELRSRLDRDNISNRVLVYLTPGKEPFYGPKLGSAATVSFKLFDDWELEKRPPVGSIQRKEQDDALAQIPSLLKSATVRRMCSSIGCSADANVVCSQCSKAAYCGEKCHLVDWETGGHAKVCNKK